MPSNLESIQESVCMTLCVCVCVGRTYTWQRKTFIFLHSPYKGANRVHPVCICSSRQRRILSVSGKIQQSSPPAGIPSTDPKVKLYFYFSCYSRDLLFGYQITGCVWFSHTSAFHVLNKSNNRLLLSLVGFRYSSSQNGPFF